MGLFRKLTKRLTPKFVRRALPKPIKKLASPLIRAVDKGSIGTVLNYAKYGPLVGPIKYGAKVLTPKASPYVDLASDIAVSAVLPGGAAKMAFNLGGFLGGVGQVLGGLQGQNAGGLRALGAVSSVVGASLTSNRAPAMAKRPQFPSPSKGPINGPKIPSQMLSAKIVGRRLFEKFPNLATAIQKYRNAGMSQVTRARLYQLLKRFGPELLITGGILTAAAVSELMMAGPGYRRMNPANIKALRRSVRRLEGFHKLCMHVDKLRRPRGRSSKARGGTQQFVRQG